MAPPQDDQRKREWWDGRAGRVDRAVHEAEVRGDLKDLPGAGKPLNLDTNVFAGDMDLAYRLAHQSGAAPLWVELRAEIERDEAALRDFLERTARFLEERRAIWTATALSRERDRSRALYLSKARDLDAKIQEYDWHRPRHMSWLESPRLLPTVAAGQFDSRIPPLAPHRDGPASL